MSLSGITVAIFSKPAGSKKHKSKLSYFEDMHRFAKNDIIKRKTG